MAETDDASIKYMADAMSWLAKQEEEFAKSIKAYKRYYGVLQEGKIYMYKKDKDYPDNPDAWFGTEFIGSWSPRSKSFMWACDNRYSPDISVAISKSGKQWFVDNLGVQGYFLPYVNSIDLAMNIAAVAARLSNAYAVHVSKTRYDDVKNELASLGKKLPVNMQKVYAYEFFAITTEKYIIRCP